MVHILTKAARRRNMEILTKKRGLAPDNLRNMLL
jgi:hypothetical protein